MEDEFIVLCYQGDLEGAKRILKKYPYINISALNECAFRYACINNHLELAKWLLSVKPDINISADNHGAFRWVCRYKHLEVAKWLQSLKPYLYVIEYSKNGKYIPYKIRNKEEEKWENRKCALHMSLQEETNILYHLPLDISKAVTLFV